jgi:hypothetical protein
VRRLRLIRALIGLFYAVPAGTAGYQASLGLAEIGVPSEGWREAFAVVGAVLVDVTAFARMMPFIPLPTGQHIVESPASPSLARPRTAEHRIVLVWLSTNAVGGPSHDRAILAGLADAV